MKAENEIVELLTESLVKQDQMIDEIKEMKDEIKGVKGEVKGVKGEIVGLKEQQAITNVLLKQHSRDLMKIADLLEENYPKFNELVEIEIMEEGPKKGVIRKVS